MIPLVLAECVAMSAAFAALYYTYVNQKPPGFDLDADVDALAADPQMLPSDFVSERQRGSAGRGAFDGLIKTTDPFYQVYYGEGVLQDNELHRRVQSQGNPYLDAFRGNPHKGDPAARSDNWAFQSFKPAMLAMYAREEEQFIGDNGVSNFYERIARKI